MSLSIRDFGTGAVRMEGSAKSGRGTRKSPAAAGHGRYMGGATDPARRAANGTPGGEILSE